MTGSGESGPGVAVSDVGQGARLFHIDDALDSDAWYTPPWIFEGLGVTLDLDVAAPAEPLAWIPARHRYTVADDGLNLPWFGLVWCNPPYSAPTAWCRRWAEHPDGFLLVRADLSTGGPFVAFSAASSVYVHSKRVQFVNGHGGSTGAVNFSSILMGRGPVADSALARLAAHTGGSARMLRATAHTDATAPTNPPGTGSSDGTDQ
jgi:hypothetical protein